MICRNCGTEIADKAIVCYRCGTSTTEPVRKPVDIRPGRGGTLVPLIGLILLIAAGLFLGQASGIVASWHAGPEVWVAYVVVVSVVLVLVLFRHFRR